MNICSDPGCRNDSARSRSTSPWHGLCSAHAELSRRAHRRATRQTETPDFMDMLTRQVGSLTRRAETNGDVYDLAAMNEFRATVDHAVVATMTAYRNQGMTWALIADGFGFNSKQACQQWFVRHGGVL